MDKQEKKDERLRRRIIEVDLWIFESEDESEEEEEEEEEETRCERPVIQHPEWDDRPDADLPQQPPVDKMYCGFCLQTPCCFLQYQEELERSVEVLCPAGSTNKAKRYHMYRWLSRELNGHLGKDCRKPLPECFVQGLRNLYPEEDPGDYKGFSYGTGQDGDGSIIS
jgi:hypothetical protein